MKRALITGITGQGGFVGLLEFVEFVEIAEPRQVGAGNDRGTGGGEW